MKTRNHAFKRNLPAALALMVFLLVRLVPGFAGNWVEAVSMPMLERIAGIGMSMPFALLECIVPAALVYMFAGLRRKCFLKRAGCLASIAALGFFCLWHPLYFVNTPDFAASPAEIAAACESIIGRLNTSGLCFDENTPLPAKFVRFPGWMDALQISGLCSFITGEALISPELPKVSRPFVAVHEAMHLKGYASEGAANIAAWQECMRLGGSYADSARIWALRYGMGMLRSTDTALYESCFARMNHRTLQSYREAGGAYLPAAPGSFIQAACSFLGVGAQMQNYEILICCLAAAPAQ